MLLKYGANVNEKDAVSDVSMYSIVLVTFVFDCLTSLCMSVWG